MAELRGWTPFAGLQLNYSLLERGIERELIPMADTLDLSIAAWAPLARGVLTGRFTRDGSSEGSRTKRENLSERDLRIAAEADAVADDLGVPTAQVALAWTRARHRWIHPIIGARTEGQLGDSIAALDLELPEDAVRRLDEASSFELGFPQDFIAMAREFVYGPAVERFRPRH
jgi:aryl-alcohol dehydrogenase-like predicted oxidoreductase